MAEGTESKKELQSKYDRLQARMSAQRKELSNTQASFLDAGCTIAGGAVGGALCNMWGPYGEGSGNVPVNMVAGLAFTALGLSDSAGPFSAEVAAVGLGMLGFQAGLLTYGDGYTPDDDKVEAGYDDEVGAEPRRVSRPLRRARAAVAEQRRNQHENISRALPQRTAITYDRIQEMLRENVAA